MAELQASWLQASSHPADTDRLVLEGLMNPAGAPISGAGYGVGLGADELKVQAKGTPNMSVDVLAGHGWIDGTEGANQGTYAVYNDATKNLVISAAHATLARKDLVVAKVQDAAYSGAVNAWSLAVVTGTPAASPAEPVVPANAIVLALVDVAAAAASITNANITDRRRRASALGGIVVCTSSTRPAVPYTGQVIYETDTNRPMVWDGSGWKQLPLKYDPPACRVFHNATQTVTNNTEMTPAFNSESFDTDTMHDLVTNNNRITFTTAGLYQIDWSLWYDTDNDYTLVYSYLQKNGSGIHTLGSQVGTQVDPNTGPTTIGAVLDKFAAGDYVTLRTNQKNTSAQAHNLAATNCVFSAVWVGRG